MRCILGPDLEYYMPLSEMQVCLVRDKIGDRAFWSGYGWGGIRLFWRCRGLREARLEVEPLLELELADVLWMVQVDGLAGVELDRLTWLGDELDGFGVDVAVSVDDWGIHRGSKVRVQLPLHPGREVVLAGVPLPSRGRRYASVRFAAGNDDRVRQDAVSVYWMMCSGRGDVVRVAPEARMRRLFGFFQGRDEELGAVARRLLEEPPAIHLRRERTLSGPG
ncbi:hypothetical protein VUR80DRAFT_6740 [Thermomyces stellatus]